MINIQNALIVAHTVCSRGLGLDVYQCKIHPMLQCGEVDTIRTQ